MAYSKVDSVIYKVDWIDTTIGSNEDITKYLTQQTAEEGLTITNNKTTLTFKMIKDKKLDDGTLAPFFTDNNGVSRLKTDGLLQPYIAYEDGSGDIKTQNNLFKTYYITDWNVNEPENKVSISGVDLSYKVTNRNISQIYSYEYYETSGFTATGTTFTDSAKSFELPLTDKYQLGLQYMTLELIDNSGDIYLYLINTNTTTTCTTHKTIASPGGGGWASYRIGWSAPRALYDAIERVARPEDGKGKIYELLSINFTTDVGVDYKNGIQLLRIKEGSTEAFPIVNIGEPYMPVYKLINEISAYTACNTETELTGVLTIKRDMIFSVVWNDDIQKTDVNWFYSSPPEIGSTTYTITAVTSTSVTLNSSSVNDLGKLARIKYIRDGNTYYRTYTITNVTGNVYTLSGDPLHDGILIADTIRVFGGVDFIWDNEDDFKHIYDMQLGSKDEEKFNNIVYNAGRNDVSGKDVTGFYFYEDTKAEALKDTFIPMTNIGKNQMHWVTVGTEGVTKVIKKEGDTWYGWDDGAGDWTSTTTDWDFTTTFGSNTIYTITDRTSFNTTFRTAAKIKARLRARAICVNQKENTLTGTFNIRGQKFTTVTTSGGLASKWYEKGTRILFSKPGAGIQNDGGKYYLFIVNKIQHTINSGVWRTRLSVEYDLYDLDELISSAW